MVIGILTFETPQNLSWIRFNILGCLISTSRLPLARTVKCSCFSGDRKFETLQALKDLLECYLKIQDCPDLWVEVAGDTRINGEKRPFPTAT